ncbi:pyridoxal phosphate-dependent transferase [Aspergillus germanicus]
MRSPDLWRIRNLSISHRFIVICDDSVANAVDVDIFPFVDIRVTSLTRTFSGSCNVAGASVVLNPDSRYYSAISEKLKSMPDTLHPADAMVLSMNSQNLEQRVGRCNTNALSVVKLLNEHELVERVHHPSLNNRKLLYGRHRRKEGGYGHVLTVKFENPNHAKRFYNTLKIAKGPGYGTSFSNCLPVIEFGYREEAKLFEEHPPQLLLMSIGMEEEQSIIQAVENVLSRLEMRDRRHYR